MIKFIDNAFVAGRYFTPGMLAEFDTATETGLIQVGDAVTYIIEASGSIENAVNAQFAQTAQTAANATTASHALTADTASQATSAQHALVADTATSASTASHAISADAATTAGHAATATTATNATTASHAATATTATNANHATTAGSANTATTALSANSANTASHATTADTATTATTAATATTATTAANANHAITADTATSAGTASSALTAATATTSETTEALIFGGAPIYPSLGKPVETLWIYAESIACVLTGVDEQLDMYPLPAWTLGVNSILQIEPLWTFTSGANNKILKVKIGGTTVYSATRTTTTREAPLIILANRNSLTSQIRPYDTGYAVAGTGTPETYSIDFSKDVLIEITGNRASSGDTLRLEYYRILHYIG